MESSGILSILVLLVLFANGQAGLSDWVFSKKCPRVRENCEFQERDMCTKDRQCQNNMKCCVFSCGKKCLDIEQDVCKLPKESGPCMALFRRWWYSSKNNTCYSFVYGGCQGNNNNFQTKDICQSTCKKKRTSS